MSNPPLAASILAVWARRPPASRGMLRTCAASEFVLHAGYTFERPHTKGPDGYRNHCKYEGTNGSSLDRQDRTHTNLGRGSRALRGARLGERASVADGWAEGVTGEPCARFTLVEWEYNEIQRDF